MKHSHDFLYIETFHKIPSKQMFKKIFKAWKLAPMNKSDFFFTNIIILKHKMMSLKSLVATQK